MSFGNSIKLLCNILPTFSRNERETTSKSGIVKLQTTAPIIIGNTPIIMKGKSQMVNNQPNKLPITVTIAINNSLILFFMFHLRLVFSNSIYIRFPALFLTKPSKIPRLKHSAVTLRRIPRMFIFGHLVTIFTKSRINGRECFFTFFTKREA